VKDHERDYSRYDAEYSGYRVKRVLGVVHGMTARTRGVGGRFIASMQTAFGGEVSAFIKEMQKAKEEALRRLVEEARKLGAKPS